MPSSSMARTTSGWSCRSARLPAERTSWPPRRSRNAWAICERPALPMQRKSTFTSPYARRVRLFILVRHGQSELNAVRRVNGDPAVPVVLTAQGEAEAEGLRLQVANVELDLCVHTRFGRTGQTAAIAIAGRPVRLHEEPLLDDIDLGDLEGETIEDYRAWKHSHRRDEAFPGGESLDDAARRYATAFERLLARP